MTAKTDPTQGAQTERFGQFVDLLRKLLTHLDLNTQLFNEIAGDGEAPRQAQVLAIGVLIYGRSGIGDIIDKVPAIGLIDDVIVMVAGLSLIVPMLPEARLSYYRDRYEIVRYIDNWEAILKNVLGILWERLVEFTQNLRRRKYRKHTAEEVAESPELKEALYDDTMAWVADSMMAPAALDRELKMLPAPEAVVGLLASGLREEQEPEGTAPKRRHGLQKRLPAKGTDR